MKYIPADKLIAEIERQIEEINKEYEKSRKPQFILRGKINGFEQTLNLVRSLQQEQPEVGLEKEIEEYFKGWFVDEDLGLVKPDNWSCIVDDLKGIARHFYELGLNARKEK